MIGGKGSIKSIKEKLSGAIKSIDPDMVERLLNQKGTNITESILKEALGQARERTRNLKESGKKKHSQENRLTKIIELLEAKRKSIGGAAPPIDDSGSQVTPAAEPKESEEGHPGSPSLSPQSSVSDGSSDNFLSFVNVPTGDESDTNRSNNGYVKVSPLPGSDSGSLPENMDNEGKPTTTAASDGEPDTLKSDSSQDTLPKTSGDSDNKEASQPVESEVSGLQAQDTVPLERVSKEENPAPQITQEDRQVLAAPEATTEETRKKEDAPVSPKVPEGDKSQEPAFVAQDAEIEDDIPPIQPTAPKSRDKEQTLVQSAEQTALQVESTPEPKSEDVQQDLPSLSPKSSVSDGSSDSSLSFVNVPTGGESDTNRSNNGCVKVSLLPGSDSGSLPENMDNEDDNKNPQPVPLTSAPGPTPVPLVPKEPAPAPSMSSLSNKDDVQSNSRQPCTTGKNDPAPQGTKASKWPVVAASALAIAGIALGVAIAVYLQMLAAGIVVGACCLVAATVIYCCGPQSSVKDSEIEKVSSKEKGPVSV
ncbi:MAG: TomO hydrophobic C-terminal domain-containing protein [Wolbachia sp.]